ncbi:MAG: hypothetical protein JW712_03120 [Dehalococcoidales bacterium]|nr:hypothetical protein [Dehalococcoidales bacterium]
MRLCAFWDCMEEVEEGISFCREHARKLNLQLIDKCPKCGRYKDVRQKLCPDCNYGRPVAGWKISSRNLGEVDESQEQPVYPVAEAPRYDDPVYENEIDISSANVSRGEATCPSCGSPNLTYKKVFDYFKCNDCETTFITPVYSYGEVFRKELGTNPPKPEPRIVQPPVRQEPPPVRMQPPPPPQPRYEHPQAPVNSPSMPRASVSPPQDQQQYWPAPEPAQWNEPAPQYDANPNYLDKKSGFNFLGKSHGNDWTAGGKAIKMSGGEKGKLGWIYMAVVICVIALIAAIIWFVFPEQISEIMGSLF